MLLLVILFAILKIAFPSCMFVFYWSIEKKTTKNTDSVKRGTKRITEKITWMFWYENYLAFPTCIYLFKTNNKNWKILCKICPKLTRKTLGQMCETKFLQMCSFSIILASLHSLNLSFPLLFYVLSTATLRFQPWFPV